MSMYTPEKMVAISRYHNYFPTLPGDIQSDVYAYDLVKRGYRDIYKNVGRFHKLMIRFCDSLVRMKIVKIEFKR